MRALLQAVDVDRPYYTSLAETWLAICEAEFARLEGHQDPEAWARAAAAWRANPYFCAYALMREGEAALAGPHGRARAAAVLGEARQIATKLGAEPLLAMVEALAAAGAPRPASTTAGAPRSEAPRGQYDLGPRELEVLRLLAAGSTDRQIGDALFISKKTASVHVANIKGKLGAGSRIEIVTSAMALGLIGPSASDETS